MDLKRKLRKLVHPDIIASTREHVARLLHPVDSAKLLARLESDPGWADLRRQYPLGEKVVHRFGDTKFWIRRNVERAQDLALDRAPTRYLLDLGCGAGFFLYVAKQLGHDGIGLDLDEQPIFRDALELTKVKRVVHRISPMQPLPAPAERFDLITSYLTCFHRIARRPDGDWKTWSPEDWQYFINDVRAHQLAPGGTLMLEFHPQRDGKLYPDDVRELFAESNARFSRSKVYLT